MKEIWKDIEGYEGIYQVSNIGRVRSLNRININGYRLRGKMLSLCKNDKGYYVVRLYNGKGVTKSVHQLVANAFIPNPNRLRVVNHIDHNKINNNVKNLEWCTQNHNVQSAKDNGSFDGFMKGVFQIDLKSGKVINEFKSIQEACRLVSGSDGGRISSCCKGDAITHNGYIWAYRIDDVKSKVLLSKSRQHNGEKSPVNKVCPKTGKILSTYESMTQAAKKNKHIGVKIGGISDCCKGRLVTHAGYEWHKAA